MKKQIILFTFLAFTLNAHAQLNLDWSQSQSLSGGIHKSNPSCSVLYGGTIQFTSNDFFEATEDSIKGVIRGIDSSGAVIYTTVLSPAVSVSAFPAADQHLAGIPKMKTIEGFMMSITMVNDVFAIVNTSPTTSRLMKIDSTGNIVWNIVLTNINRVSAYTVDSSGNTCLIGRTPEQDSAGYKSNGIAIAKYNSSGQQVWKKTKYTNGFRTFPYNISLDTNGRVIVTGKKAAKLFQPQSAFDKSFVTVYESNGTHVWTKEYNSFLMAIEDVFSFRRSDAGADTNGDVWFADTQYDSQTNVPTVKIRKLNGATGATVFTKTINNSELNGVVFNNTCQPVVATSSGIKTYNNAGTLLWSNGYLVEGWQSSTTGCGGAIVAKNVSATEPLSNFLVQLDVTTGSVLYQKNLSFGNHEEYAGEHVAIALDVWEHAYLLINDIIPPYGTRLTKLSQCSDFTYNFNASAATVNVNNATCDNGSITVSWSGTFNSWPHFELYNSAGTLVAQTDIIQSAVEDTFQHLPAAIYTLKAFDESCGEQDITITVKCPAPSTGMATVNITNISAKAKWNAPACNNNYRLQYRQTGTSSWTTISGVTATDYTITGLTPGTGYQWRVATKCNSTGTAVYSNYSVIKSFTTQATRIAGEYIIPVMNEISVEINPNPVGDKMMITSEDGISAAVMKIFNAQGQLVLEKNIKALNENETVGIEMGSMTNGIYLMQMISEEGIAAKRFLKE